MGLERIVHEIRNLKNKGLTAGLLGLGIFGMSMPAYAQEKQDSRVSYIPCRQETAYRGNTGEALSILGLAIGLERPNDPDAQKAAVLLSTLGQMRHQKEVAREGRSQLNIEGEQPTAERYLPAPGCAWSNPENPNDFSVRLSIGVPFAANGWRDINYNMIVNSNEFVGVKDRFYDDETIILGLYPRFIDKVKYEIYSPNDEKIREGKINVNSSYSVWWGGTVVNYLPKEAYIEWDPETYFRGYGIYTIVWRDGRRGGELFAPDRDKYEGVTEVMKFEILPASSRQPN